MKDGQTIGQWLKWDFAANGVLVIRDKNKRPAYFENSRGAWVKYEYDSEGRCTAYEDSDSNWSKSEYNSKGRQIYFECSPREIECG